MSECKSHSESFLKICTIHECPESRPAPKAVELCSTGITETNIEIRWCLCTWFGELAGTQGCHAVPQVNCEWTLVCSCIRPVWLAVCHDESTVKEELCFDGLQSINCLKAECVTRQECAFSGGCTFDATGTRYKYNINQAANILVLLARNPRSSARAITPSLKNGTN